VKLASDRHFLIRKDSVSPRFYEKFRNVLANTPRTFQYGDISDPHLALVHDVDLPIPMYYFPTITGEIEAGYEKVMANEQRAFQVHTDFNWEYSLPNLNPDKAEMQVTSSIEVLLDGVVTKVFGPEGGQWIWRREANSPEQLGSNLSEVLYRVVNFLADPFLGGAMRTMIQSQLTQIGAPEYVVRLATFRENVGKLLENSAMRKFKHEGTREDELEMPILRALRDLATKRLERDAKQNPSSPPPASGAASLGGLV